MSGAFLDRGAGDGPSDLLSRAECEALAKRVLSFAKADETRVSINCGVRSDTRFAVNQISTSGEDVDAQMTIQSAFGKRSASVTTNKFDDASLAAAVAQAEALARLAAENPEAMPELGPQQYPALVERRVVMPGAADRAAAVKAVTELARRAKCIATGYLETERGATAIATSRGLFAYAERSGSAMTVTARTADGLGSGWAGAEAETWGGIDAAQLGAHALEKARRSRDPRPMEPGRYTVVLEPTAVGDLVQLIAAEAGAREADEGRSFFSKPGGGTKIGERILDERVTLVSDPEDWNGSAISDDGLPARRVTWVEKGVLKTLDYDRYWAHKSGVEPTAAPGNTLRLLGGKMTLPQMIASTEQGVLVTRFWYIREVDPRTILYTGLTRDGTFSIENGKVTQAIKNFRFNESPIFMLNRINAMGVPVRVCTNEDGSPGGGIIMPALKTYDFNFTSVSDAV